MRQPSGSGAIWAAARSCSESLGFHTTALSHLPASITIPGQDVQSGDGIKPILVPVPDGHISGRGPRSPGRSLAAPINADKARRLFLARLRPFQPGFTET